MQTFRNKLQIPFHLFQYPNCGSRKLVLSIGFFYLTSICHTLFTKWILLDTYLPYPIIITWFQLLFQTACFYVCSYFSRTVPQDSIGIVASLPKFEVDTNLVKIILPGAMLYCSMLVSSNLSLFYLEINYYTVLRSFTIIFSTIFTVAYLKKKSSSQASLAILLLAFGLIIFILSENNFSWVGLFFSIISCFSLFSYSIFVKTIAQSLTDDHWKLLFYNVVISSVLLSPLVLISGEILPILFNLNFWSISLWILNILAATFAFLLNIAVFIQIKFTSPFTQAVSGSVRPFLLAILAILFFSNSYTFISFIGYLLVIAGTALHSLVRLKEAHKI